MNDTEGKINGGGGGLKLRTGHVCTIMTINNMMNGLNVMYSLLAYYF